MLLCATEAKSDSDTRRVEKDIAYSFGCRARARTDFLWLVRVHVDLPWRMSQKRMVLSCEPEMICGSYALAATDATVLVWPLRQWTWALVRMSHSWKQRHKSDQGCRKSMRIMKITVYS